MIPRTIKLVTMRNKMFFALVNKSSKIWKSFYLIVRRSDHQWQQDVTENLRESSAPWYDQRDRYNLFVYGSVISRKFGKSVLRNRARRLIKAAILELYQENKISDNVMKYSYIFIPRNPILNMSWQDLKSNILHILYFLNSSKNKDYI